MHVFHTLPHPSRRSRNLLRALALASLAVAGFMLPFVWDLLAGINGLPRMAWLQAVLARVPILSWLMMFFWGTAVPLALLIYLHQSPRHRLRNALVVLGLMLVAVIWHAHMPISGLCAAIYPNATWACDILQWGYSLSLGIATATYVFTMLAMGFSALGLLAENLGDPVQA